MVLAKWKSNYMAQSLSKLQIETAEQVLKKALTEKNNKIAKEKFEEACQPFARRMATYLRHKDAVEKERVELNKDLEATKKLHIGRYGNGNEIEAIGAGTYSHKYGNFTPESPKETKIIEDFIVGLKLGTNLMAELEEVIKQITK